jgi:hypothetical protein
MLDRADNQHASHRSSLTPARPDLNNELGQWTARDRVLHAAITLYIDPIHDIGLFVFEGAWVALGIAVVRKERPHEGGDAASAPV